MIDLTKALEEAQSWAINAGRIQRENLGNVLVINTKSTTVDLVTEVDRLSEEIILNSIRHTYSGHAILSEESGENDISSDYCWIVDPLDGTTNYAQGLHVFAVSIALQYKDETILGVIYSPVLNHMFTAVKGQGACLNGKRINVGQKSELHKSLLATGFPYDRAIHKDNNLNYFSRLMPKVRGIRRLGSAAYDLANVAAGIFDGYWELNLSTWDVAAGALMVEEAGGKVVYLPQKRGVSLVAGNDYICDKILEEIRAEDLVKGQEQNV